MTQVLQSITDLSPFKLVVRYSATSNEQIACVWTYESDKESTTIISVLKFNYDLFSKILADNFEWALNEFLNPHKSDKTAEIQLARLKDILNDNSDSFKSFIAQRRGSISGKDFGF